MADIRIKDLTTLASTTASDDVLPIDGTTNGTRKLSAFSPSFGGNATVGGTLTVNGSGTSAIGGMLKGAAATYSGNPPTGVTSAFQVDVENATTRDVLSFGDASRAGLLRGYHDGSGGIRWQFGRYAGGAYDEYARFEGTTAANGKLLIYGTTASTSTSSGALVVGNGTSGGLGVGGNIYAGGSLSASGTTTADGLATSGFFGGSKRVIVGYNTSSDYGFIASVDTGVGWKELQLNPSGGMVKVPSSTASTSTSSGALVVSGGVGVAGALYAANLGGTSTNNNAASGCIGEYTSATTAYASKVSLTSNTAANIVSISLTAGDWDVQFNPVFTQDTPLTTSGLLAGVSSSSATLPSGAAERAHSPSGPNGNSDLSIAPPVTRISLASTTTIYGVATGIFSAGTMSAYGFIRARRVR